MSAEPVVVSAIPDTVRRGPLTLDTSRLARVGQRAAELPRLRSLLVAHRGDIVGEWYFHGARADDPTNIKSASKSVLSALVGVAVAEGKLSGVEQPIASLLERELPADPDPRLARVTVGDLLSMRAGLESTSFANYGRWVTSRNWVRSALSRPFVAEPGGRMIYSTGNTHLLSAALTRATGQDTWSYARDRLAEPLGISLPRWPRDPQGIYFGGNDMRLRPRDLLRLGELYRNGGAHGERQILPRSWVCESWTRRTTSPFNGHGYGYGWWMRELGGRPVYFAWGYGGQYVFVVPSLELTVVMTSDPTPGPRSDHRSRQFSLLVDGLFPAIPEGETEGPCPYGGAGAS